MRQDYIYTIEASEYDGNWQLLERDTDRSARSPRDYARGLLENWIIAHPERLYGGERVQVYDGQDPAPPENLVHLRVCVYREPDDAEHAEPELAAVSYLQYAESEY